MAFSSPSAASVFERLRGGWLVVSLGPLRRGFDLAFAFSGVGSGVGTWSKKPTGMREGSTVKAHASPTPAMSAWRLDSAQCPCFHPSEKDWIGRRGHEGGIHWYSMLPKYW